MKKSRSYASSPCRQHRKHCDFSKNIYLLLTRPSLQGCAENKNKWYWINAPRFPTFSIFRGPSLEGSIASHMDLRSGALQVKAADQHEQHTIRIRSKAAAALNGRDRWQRVYSFEIYPEGLNTMCSLWRVTQAGYCVSVGREEKEGSEVGQLCEGVNCWLCQQNDVVW